MSDTNFSFTFRCRPFQGRPISTHTMRVEGDAVLVYDEVACHFTRCHSISPYYTAKILRHHASEVQIRENSLEYYIGPEQRAIERADCSQRALETGAWAVAGSARDVAATSAQAAQAAAEAVRDAAELRATTHSTHDRRADAQDQADMVGGRVVTVDDTGSRMPAKTVTCGGDVITVAWNGNVWVAPCCGSQHARAVEAMRVELTRYLSDCGEMTEESLDEMLADMQDA